MTRLLATAMGYELDLDSVSDEARQVMEQLRGFAVVAHKVMFRRDLDARGREAGLLRLLQRAREASWPEGACRVVERAVFEHIFGRDPEAWYWEMAIQEAIAREHPGRIKEVA